MVEIYKNAISANEQDLLDILRARRFLIKDDITRKECLTMILKKFIELNFKEVINKSMTKSMTQLCHTFCRKNKYKIEENHNVKV